MSSIWIYVNIHVCPASRLSCEATLDIMRKLFNQLFVYLPCLKAPLIYTLFSDLDFGCVHKASAKQISGFIFLHTFYENWSDPDIIYDWEWVNQGK